MKSKKNNVKEFWKGNKKYVLGYSAIAAIAFACWKISRPKDLVRIYESFTTEEILRFIKESKNKDLKYCVFKETAEDAFQIIVL